MLAESLERNGQSEPLGPEPRGNRFRTPAGQSEIVLGASDGIGMALDVERNVRQILVLVEDFFDLVQARLKFRRFRITNDVRIRLEIDLFVVDRHVPRHDLHTGITPRRVVSPNFDAQNGLHLRRRPGNRERCSWSRTIESFRCIRNGASGLTDDLELDLAGRLIQFDLQAMVVEIDLRAVDRHGQLL